jgi:hypothetical protein
MTAPAPAGYIALPVTTDPEALASDAIAYLAAQQPGWVAREGHLETWMLRAFARMANESAKVAAQAPLAIFRYFGERLLDLPPLVGARAQASSTWTLTDTAGHTIPAGTTVGYRTSASSLVLLRTVADVVVPAGSNRTAAGAVLLEAVEVGGSVNGLPAAPLVVVDNLAAVAAVETTTVTAGGADAETESVYLDRLAAELQLLSPRPILPKDFAALARNEPYVGRAVAIDGFNRSDGSYGNARLVTVAAVDALGQPLTTSQKNTLRAKLDGAREVNFVVDVIDPTYTTVDITAQVVPLPGENVATVSKAVVSALMAFLSPAQWGGPSPAWHNTTAVRYLTVAHVLNGVPGVDYVSGLQIASGGGQLATVDAVLFGAAPLPRVGALNVVIAGVGPDTGNPIPEPDLVSANATLAGLGTVTAGAGVDSARFANATMGGVANLAASPGATAGGDGVQAAVTMGWGTPMWGDEFEYTGRPDGNKWGLYDGPGHVGNGLRRPSAWTVANGVCTCFGDAGGTTGGMAFKQSRQFYRVECRARMYETSPGSSGSQYHPVLLLWPDSDRWPNDGELDYMETDIGQPDIDAFMHHPATSVIQDHYSKNLDITVWHNYALEWRSGLLIGYVDGVEWFRDSGSWVSNIPAMHETVQLDNFGGSTHKPAVLELMFFRAYSL